MAKTTITTPKVRPALSGFFKLLTLCLPLFVSLSSALTPDGLSLLALKSAITSDPNHFLATWSESDSSPCHWLGILCTRGGLVTDVFLSDKQLTGYLPSELGAVLSLRRLSLSGNNFSGRIPVTLFNATSLVSLDLSHNCLSGPIPGRIGSLRNLVSLDLSSNSLNGSLPSELTELTQLSGTVNLSFNSFSGKVPASYGRFPVMVSLDLRHNNLTGKIPQVGSLLNQGPTAFAGNPNLCGFPLSTPCPPEAQNPNALPENPNALPENPSNPKTSKTPEFVYDERERGNKRKLFSVILISGLFAVVGGALFLSLWVGKKKLGVREETMGKKVEKLGLEVVRVGDDDEEGQNGKFVVVDEEGFGLELEDLLRASAFVVGKSRSGIVYRVVVGGGGAKGSVMAVRPSVVAVRRLSEGEGSPMWRVREFESEVEAIGRVHHPNVVRLRAYYYANDEKLLVSDFIGNGSLYTALHGGSSNELAPLSWASRMKIAQGTARGLTHIHECNPKKYVHGNIKSSKILLDENLNPYISGFGLNRLVCGASRSANPTSRRPPSVAYVAPEVRTGMAKLTQKCDVYSFGVVLLEMLTGRVPENDSNNEALESLVRKVFREERPLSEIIDPSLLHEVYAKKQVLAVFHIALNCTEIDPELRPRIRSVCDSLDHIKFRGD